jgi:hypothetical protein
MIKGLQQQVQKMGQALQAAGVELKFGIEKEKIKQEGETQRTLLTTTTKAHDTEMATSPRSATTPRREPSPRRTSRKSAAGRPPPPSTSTPRTWSARSKRATWSSGRRPRWTPPPPPRNRGLDI